MEGFDKEGKPKQGEKTSREGPRFGRHGERIKQGDRNRGKKKLEKSSLEGKSRGSPIFSWTKRTKRFSNNPNTSMVRKKKEKKGEGKSPVQKRREVFEESFVREDIRSKAMKMRRRIEKRKEEKKNRKKKKKKGENPKEEERTEGGDVDEMSRVLEFQKYCLDQKNYIEEEIKNSMKKKEDEYPDFLKRLPNHQPNKNISN